MKSNKGFTIMEVLTSFVILSLLLGIGIVSYRFIIERFEKNYYEVLEKELLLAGNDYYNNHREEKPITGYGMVLIDDLVGDKYIETLKDRNGKVCSTNNDSKVYIYKTDSGYDYEACLFCDDDYPPSGNYCNGNITEEIIISAKKENTKTEYNVLKVSYNNTSWSNENIVVSFKMNDKNVTKYIIVDVNDNSEKICNSIDNRCSMTFTSSGGYTVEAYDGENVVGSKRSFYVKIDKDKPVCEFVSGPSVELINKNLRSTYELECTDNNLDSASISVNNFSQTSENVISIQNIGTNNITNGYKYVITIVGNLDGETALKLNEAVIKDKAGNGNLGITSNSVISDVTAPVIDYNLSSGDYDENKNVTVTVSDAGGISEIEYMLYKDEELVSNGNPVGASPTSISFDISLYNDGIWELFVKARDIVGNYNNQDVNSEGYSYRKYIIESCNWVHISTEALLNCMPILQPENPTVGDTYSECLGPYTTGRWRYVLGKVTCSNGEVSNYGFTSEYEYSSSNEAGVACQSEYQNSTSTCEDIGSSVIGGVNCATQSEENYQKKTYEYKCE